MTEFAFVDLDAALAAAVKAARSAGSIMKECHQIRYAQQARSFAANSTADAEPADANGPIDLCVDEKTSSTDLVTKYDKMCDATIMEVLQLLNEGRIESERYNFITEETFPDAPVTNHPTWIVDPIDGTMSFVHHSFDSCVSIGLAINRKPVLGVVFCPFIGHDGCGELFTAVKGKGAFMNGQQICVSTACTSIPKAVVIFNNPWRTSVPAIDASINIRTELAHAHVHAIRAYGACVMQLAQVAAGRADLYMEPGGKSWDVCAGAILVAEAGGVVTALGGGEFTLEEHTITAAATQQLSDFGCSLCRKYDYRRNYFLD